MKQHLALARQIIFSVVVERVSRYLVDQYLMPMVERMPTKKRKPFGFNQ